ncbi:rhodanese-like domain-containing protein [Herbaspirillum sp. YR522]|uniref:rhodanese-like domain-containing protein n=1 Tax=Herbaspirillum sp. YR522 TaxID=1144342 RepID=UPI00026F9096|nr:rhodanese-like domain-containing protein [Herbaspirillum sp. YR522]EJN09826.1 Rhodanese-related sulfurtransferase [Herbaspirillum sp. YR522]
MTQIPTPSALPVPASTLAAWLRDGDEIALVDVGEAGQFGEGHLLLAVNLPYSRFELDLPQRVPRLDTRLVLVSEDGELAQAAASAALSLGYRAVHWLEGGTTAWRGQGLKTFQGVNVPSKAFSEFVEKLYHTPDIEPRELAMRQQAGEDLVLLDSRTLEEHRRFHVPGAISCPGSEIVTRFADLVSSPDTLVVVTCAGRTRGIMGAQSLIDAGVPNRVLALAGGTQGWRLAGLELERQPAQESRLASPQANEVARKRAAALEEKDGLARIELDTLRQWQADEKRTTFVFDIRTRSEYDQGHWPGAAWVQGVQLVQCLDEWVAVRHAHVVLVDTDGSRAAITAHWLQRLGVEVALFAPPTEVAQALPTVSAVATPTRRWEQVAALSPETARQWVQGGALVLDAGSSERHGQAHPQNARWVNRSALSPELLSAAVAAGKVVVLADQDGVAQLLALSLSQLLVPDHAGLQIAILPGGLEGWQAAGLPLAEHPELPPRARRIDYLFWLHDRHAGNAEASAAYLQWEADLPELVGNAAQAGYRF